MTRPVSVALLAFGAEPYLAGAVASVLASEGVEIELVIVDNGCTTTAVERLPADSRVTVLRPGRNLGFAGGVNYAVAASRHPTIALVNSDAEVAPGAIARLADLVADPSVGVAGGLVVLADDPGTINSAGNPVHVLGLSWAGSMGRPVAEVAGLREVASASGACMAVRRSVWDELGGFADRYFAYLEDLELGWRCWQRGLRVVVDPGAVAVHHYEFGRSPLKMYLLERNRLVFLLTVHQARTLILLALPLLAFEIAVLATAVVQGWGRAKVRGYRWLIRNAGWIRRRRRLVQGSRQVPDRDLAHLVADVFDPAQTPLPSAARPLETLLRWYWRLVRRVL